MIFCDLERLNPETVRCKRCGRERQFGDDVPLESAKVQCRANQAQPQPKRQNGNGRSGPPKIPTCIHRGMDDVRSIPCQSCGGKSVQLKVFPCEVHGECTIGKNGDGLANCFECADRSEREVNPVVLPRRRLRVGFITPTLCHPGGAERWLASLIKYLPAGLEAAGVAVVFPRATDDVLVREVSRYCQVISGPQVVEQHMRYARENIHIASHDQEACWLVAQRSDVLVVWGCVPPIPQKFPGPVIVVAQGCCEWTEGVIRGCLPIASHFVAVSEAAREAFPKRIRERVSILWNQVDFERIVPTRDPAEVRKELDIPEGHAAIGYIGRYGKEKNPLSLARAVALLPDTVGVYIGGGWEVRKFQREALAIAGGRLRFIQPPEYLGDYYAALDALMLASPKEGFSLTVAEAWAAGCPVVCTPVGGVPEMERRFGELTIPVSFDSPAEMHAAAVARAVSEGRSHPRVHAAREVAWRELSATRIGKRWGEFLLGLISVNR